MDSQSSLSGSTRLQPNLVSVRALDALDPKDYKDVDEMKDALEKVFVKEMKDDAWNKDEDLAPESLRPISANPLFPFVAIGVLYKVCALIYGLATM